MTDLNNLIPVKEVAEKLGIPPRDLRTKFREDGVNMVNVTPRRWLVDKDDVDKWLGGKWHKPKVGGRRSPKSRAEYLKKNPEADSG